MSEAAARYCVLRMAGPRTLAVAEWLVEHGVAAWTPTQTIKRRRPRSKAASEVTAPIASTFVFAPAADAGELLRLSRDPASPHPRFSLLRHEVEVVYIRHRELDGLRDAEESAKPRQGSARRQRPTPHAIGAEIQVDEGAFAGLTGIVASSDGRRTYLDFGGLLGRVEVDTSLLPVAA